MIDNYPPPQSADLPEQVKFLRIEMEDRLDDLQRQVRQLQGGGSVNDRIATQTFGQEGATLPQFNYVNPTVNVVSFLDPLWAQLRSNEVAVRESRIEFDSVGTENIRVNSIRARHIVAGSIVTELLAADSVTADKISVNTLSAIVANLGTITAGNITLDTSGFIRGGATAYNTGTGFWMGYDTAAYKFFIGAAAGNKLLWDGATLAITGSITATSGTIGGFDIGSDYIRDTANTFGLASTVTGGDDVRFWAGASFASRASAPIRITEAGAVTIAGGSVTIATTNRVVASDSASFLTWQGPSGANTAGYYTQQSAAGGGFTAYGVGSGSPAISLYRSAGSYGSPSNLAANTIVGTLFISGYNSGAYNEVGKHTWGISANGNTPYYRIEVMDAASVNYQSWVFNYDGKLYFNAANDAFSPNSGIYAAPYVADSAANLYRSTTGTIKTDGSFVVASTCTAATFSGSGASITSLNGSNISSGTVGTARLGSGAASSSTFLRGDQSWATIAAANVSGLAASATTDTTNASNISSGTLGRPVTTSLFTIAGTSVDALNCNIRAMSGASPVVVLNISLPGITINGTQVIGPRSATVPTTLADVISILQTHGLCS